MAVSEAQRFPCTTEKPRLVSYLLFIHYLVKLFYSENAFSCVSVILPLLLREFESLENSKTALEKRKEYIHRNYQEIIN